MSKDRIKSVVSMPQLNGVYGGFQNDEHEQHGEILPMCKENSRIILDPEHNTLKP